MSKSTDMHPIDEIRPEHYRLGLIFEETRTNLVDEEGRAACVELREALEAHFAQEEALYYPTLWKLHPQHEGKLRGLIAAHADFLSAVDLLIGLLEQGESTRVRAGFEELQARFVSHERAEEALLQSMS